MKSLSCSVLFLHIFTQKCLQRIVHQQLAKKEIKLVSRFLVCCLTLQKWCVKCTFLQCYISGNLRLWKNAPRLPTFGWKPTPALRRPGARHWQWVDSEGGGGLRLIYYYTSPEWDRYPGEARHHSALTADLNRWEHNLVQGWMVLFLMWLCGDGVLLRSHSFTFSLHNGFDLVNWWWLVPCEIYHKGLKRKSAG